MDKELHAYLEAQFSALNQRIDDKHAATTRELDAVWTEMHTKADKGEQRNRAAKFGASAGGLLGAILFTIAEVTRRLA